MNAVRPALGFSWPVLVGLAALATPRLVLHDLGIVNEGGVVAGLLVIVPPALWIAAVLWRRPDRPFRTVVVIGALYGVFLAAGHQLLWTAAFDRGTPTLASALTGIDPTFGEAVLRTAAVLSSLVTGTLVGVVAGGVALLLTRIVPAEAGGDRSRRPQ
jgi:drug/metabolite transporter (DMT)-like permease